MPLLADNRQPPTLSPRTRSGVGTALQLSIADQRRRTQMRKAHRRLPSQIINNPSSIVNSKARISHRLLTTDHRLPLLGHGFGDSR